MHKECAGRPRLRDQFREAIRVRHYSHRTEKTYWYWIRYFIRFHKLRHPAEMAEREVLNRHQFSRHFPAVLGDAFHTLPVTAFH